MKTIILAAGFGSRLWPLSTSERPKQFQPLIGNTSLLRYTYDSIKGVIPPDDIYVLGLAGMEPLIQEQLPELPSDHMVMVPERRNTLPHTLWALASITNDPTEPVLFKGVDHYLSDIDAFRTSLQHIVEHYTPSPAISLLCAPYRTFNSNDGYCLTDDTGTVKVFLEKPTEQELTTQAAGLSIYRTTFMYIASQDALLSSLQSLSGDWVANAKAILTSTQPAREKAFLALPFMDISSTIFGTAHNLRVIDVDYDFIDVGRFAEIYELNDKDANGNVYIGKVISQDAKNNLIINTAAVPLVVIGKQDTVIVKTENGSLVATFAEAAKVGEIYKSQIHQH